MMVWERGIPNQLESDERDSGFANNDGILRGRAER